MSFIDGMVLCFIGGFLNSYLYRRYLRKRNRGWILWFAMIFLITIITYDLLIFFNIIDVRGLFPFLNIPLGVNAGVYYSFNPIILLLFQYNAPIVPIDSIIWVVFASFFIISYIFWFTIGQNLGRFLFGRLTFERGAWYLFRSTKSIKRSKEKFEKKSQKA